MFNAPSTYTIISSGVIPLNDEATQIPCSIGMLYPPYPFPYKLLFLQQLPFHKLMPYLYMSRPQLFCDMQLYGQDILDLFHRILYFLFIFAIFPSSSNIFIACLSELGIFLYLSFLESSVSVNGSVVNNF